MVDGSWFIAGACKLELLTMNYEPLTINFKP